MICKFVDKPNEIQMVISFNLWPVLQHFYHHNLWS